MNPLFRVPGTLAYLAALFINAFTDLGHKIIIQNTVFKIYDDQEQIILTTIVNALVLLPFILLFSPSGHIADRYPKNRVMVASALLAVVVTLGITYTYYHGHFFAAFALTFLLAAQSALYSPAKYGYLKELVGEGLISQGNAAVQAATTVAILSGILAYTVFFEGRMPETYENEADILRAVAPLGWGLVLGSVIELLLTLRLPRLKEPNPDKRFEPRKYLMGAYLQKNMRRLTRKKEIIRAVLWLSVFWTVSQVLLAVFGAYAKSHMGIENTIIVQGIMTLAGIGIILGSLSAARFSRYYVHSGLSLLGALGMALSLLLIPYLTTIPAMAANFLLFGICSGLFIVPLNSLIQLTAPGVHLGTILAGNNFIQNIFMFSGLVLTTLFAYYGMNAVTLFYLLFALMALVVYTNIKTHLLMFYWLVVEIVLALRYRIEYEGLAHLPKEGAVLLLGNHISWLDWALLQFPYRRRIHYLMDRGIYSLPLINPVLRLAGVIPVSPGGAKEAFKEAGIRLRRGDVVGIFPEGSISYDGRMGAFKKGFEQIAKHHRGVIVPFYISGIYGSRFSRSSEKYVAKRKGFRRVIRITFGPPLPMDASAEKVREAIEALH